MEKQAIVLGASGLIGGHLIDCLLESSEYRSVLSIGRSKLHCDHPKLSEKIIDFKDFPKTIEELPPNSHFFCTIGTTIKIAGTKENFKIVDYHYPMAFADLAKSQNAASFHIISSVGANKSSPFFYQKIKGLLEQDIAQLGLSSLYIYRPSLLIGNRSEPRPFESISQKVLPLFDKLLIGPFKDYQTVNAKDVAQKMYFDSLLSLKGIHYISGEQITQK